jgi:hypothetical protein
MFEYEFEYESRYEYSFYLKLNKATIFLRIFLSPAVINKYIKIIRKNPSFLVKFDLCYFVISFSVLMLYIHIL